MLTGGGFCKTGKELAYPCCMSSSIELRGVNGRAVLLLHGLCANPLELLPVAKVLHRAGYTVRVPLLQGYGVDARAARAGEPSGTYEDWLQQARWHSRELARTHAGLAVGGLCMGAVMALALAAETKLCALLLISPTLYYDGWNVSRWRWLLPLAYLPLLRQRLSFVERPPYGIKNKRLRTWVSQALARDGVSAAGAARLPAASLYQATRLIHRVQTLLPSVHTPTLVLHATEDDVAGPRTVYRILDQLGICAQVEWFHDSYHMLTLDNERDAVAAAALQFITSRMPALPSAMAA